MRSLLFVFLVACGGGAKSTPPTTPLPPASEPTKPAPIEIASGDALPECKPMTSTCIIDTLDAFSNRMCGCKDRACADKVNGDMTSWAQTIAEDPTMASSKPTESEVKRATAVTQKYAECMTKLIANEPPPENPCG